MESFEALSVLNAGGNAIRRPDRPVRVLGIDLGTTNSTAAEVTWSVGQGSPPQARCVEIDQNTLEGTYTHTLVPSGIALYEGNEWIGEGAKRLRARGPQFGLERNRDLFYECKNDIGLRRTYSEAPDGFRNASEIAARVLAYIVKACAGDTAFDRVVVTVPASFQLAQRQDTRDAAKRAGIDMQPGDLLDEPVAAFLDYLVSNKSSLAGALATPKTLVVFDFGGGTCDVAVLRLGAGHQATGRINISPAAVSRYHRLGGGDIDAAIVYEVLVPQLCEQNGIDGSSLDFRTKKVFIEPALLGIAEALKIGLCGEIRRLESFGKYDNAARLKLVKKQPGTYQCHTPLGDFSLRNPTLSAVNFDELLKPFLDHDLLYARETEYRLTLSVFAPIQDALDRAGLSPSDVDLCLLVGGSSLIPQVAAGVRQFFKSATVLKYSDATAIQTSVARGAAYQALALAVFGVSPCQAVAYDDIAIRTSSGPVTLVAKGTSLPFPSDHSFAVNRALVAPETVLKGESKLQVELVAGREAAQRTLVNRMWRIPAIVSQGDPLELKYRVTEDQVLDFELRLADSPAAAPFSESIENPLTHVSNPQKARLEIDRIEEELRTGTLPSESPAALAQLGELHVEVGQREKALDYLRRALAASKGPDANLLNQMASVHGDLGHVEQQEKLYLEAARVSSWSGSLFNLALARMRRSDNAAAIKAVDDALSREVRPPYLVLRGALAGRVGDASGQQQFLRRAFELFGPVRGLSDWELGWLEHGAKLAGRADLVEEAEQERKDRVRSGAFVVRDALLPDIAPALRIPS